MTDKGTPDPSSESVNLPSSRTPDPQESYSPKIFLREKLADEDGDDRRGEPRRSYNVGVYLDTDDAQRFGLTGNISSGGLFVVAEDPPPLGSKVSLDFLLPNGADSLVVEGRVRWVRQPSDEQDRKPPGFGVEFDELDATQRELLEQLLDQLDTPSDSDGEEP